MGNMLSPIVWLMGVNEKDCLKVGLLLGTKIIVNELVGYKELGQMMRGNAISVRNFINYAFQFLI